MSRKLKLISEEVQKIAKLANLKLAKDEIKKFQTQLSETISYVEKLKKLDTKKVPPTSQVTGLENVFREDKVEPSISQEEALSGAKETYNGFFKVRAVFNSI